MTSPSTSDPTGRVACITVTFNPDMAVFARQMQALPPGCAKVVVDNASRAELVSEIAQTVAATPNACLLRNRSNLGLGAALNSGAAHVRKENREARFILLLDQDSEPAPGSIAQLVLAFEQLGARGERVGTLGPKLIDPGLKMHYGFHRATRWRWIRQYPRANDAEPVVCSNINGSGALVPTAVFADLGGLDESLFIDHVDTDWSFRVLAAGYTLWGIPDAVFWHRMGERGLRFWWFGWHVWPHRSPRRHYFLFRNTVRLLRRSYVPRVWKFWNVVKLALTLVVHGIFDSERTAQVRNMLRGLRDGFGHS